MQKQRRNRTSTKTSVEDEIAHLRGLDLKGLRSRWQGVFQRAAPAHLTRLPRPKRLLRTRSRICTVSISGDYVHAGRAYFKGRLLLI